jgi:ribonuclease J
VALCGDGDILRLTPGPAQVVGEVPAGRVYRDGQMLIDAQSVTISQRRKLSFAGIVSAAIAIDDRGGLVGEPEIGIAGLPEFVAPNQPMQNFVLDAIYECLDSLPKQKRRDPEAVEEAVSRSIRSQVNGIWGKKPVCHVLVLQV